MSLQVSVPGKIVLFGEWAVVSGGAGIASTVNTHLKLELTPNSDPRATVFASGEQTATSRDLAQSCEGFFGLASTTVATFPHDLWLGKKINFQCGWKPEEGLGSSSAVVLTLLLANRFLSGQSSVPSHFERVELWKRGREIIRAQQSARASGLDLAAQLFGHQVLLQGNEPMPLKLTIPPQLRIIHTGDKACTPKALNTLKPDPGILTALHNSVMSFLRNHDWIDTMDEHAELLQKLGVVPEAIATARQNWINKSWVHALKTTGAGGGDALLVWIEPEFERELTADIQARGWWLSPHAIGAAAGSVHES